MFTQRQTILEKVIFSVAAVLTLLTTAGQSATLDNLHPTAGPAVLDPMLTTQPDNGSMEEPRVLRMHKPCREEHANYCENDGQCMYPQDTDTPSCMCKPSYSGTRCLFFVGGSQIAPNYEEVIGIGVGVAMLIFFLAIIFYCCVRKRCTKSAQMIKLAPSENSV
ncbi:epigen-like [Centroberyx gerrardi]|uniref:epigen-like n=1 Tax=Centroberyx gerrardi TaxID=166262 RepID=UPI003AAEFAE2